MRVTLAQLVVSSRVSENVDKILAVIGEARAGDWLVFPECALTGYFPEDDSFLNDVDPGLVYRSLAEISKAVQAQRCICVLGTPLNREGRWYNSVVVIQSAGLTQAHHKIELSELDSRHFVPGERVSALDVGPTRIGIQVCRELLFPGAWMQLAAAGAQIVFHVNNAIKPYDDVWEHVLIARAIENGVAVCSVNNAAAPQELRSYLVAPSGQVLVRSDKQLEQTLTREIDLELSRVGW